MTHFCCGSGSCQAIVLCMYVLHMWHPITLLTMRELPLLMSLSKWHVTLQMPRCWATSS